MTRSITLAVALVAVLASPGFAAKIRVPSDFPTLQEAVDNAAAGDTIEFSGTRNEFVRISESADLAITGKGGATIKAPAGQHGIEIVDSTRITIRGVRLEDGDRGVLIRGSTDVVVERCKFKNTGGTSIDARASTNVTVSRCRVENSGAEGIAFGATDGSEPVTTGLITRCVIRNTVQEGIRVVGTDIVVSRCSADSTGDDGFDASRSVFSARIRFERCRSTRSEDEAFRTDIPGTEFVKCFAAFADEEGFDVQASDGLVERCKTRDCRRGIEIQNATGGSVLKCKISRPRQIGIFVTNSTGVRVEKCSVVKAGENGVEVDFDSTGNTFIRTKARKSGDVDLRDETGGSTNTYERSSFKTEDFSVPQVVQN